MSITMPLAGVDLFTVSCLRTVRALIGVKMTALKLAKWLYRETMRWDKWRLSVHTALAVR